MYLGGLKIILLFQLPWEDFEQGVIQSQVLGIVSLSLSPFFFFLTHIHLDCSSSGYSGTPWKLQFSPYYYSILCFSYTFGIGRKEYFLLARQVFLFDMDYKRQFWENC